MNSLSIFLKVSKLSLIKIKIDFCQFLYDFSDCAPEWSFSLWKVGFLVPFLLEFPLPLTIFYKFLTGLRYPNCSWQTASAKAIPIVPLISISIISRASVSHEVVEEYFINGKKVFTEYLQMKKKKSIYHGKKSIYRTKFHLHFFNNYTIHFFPDDFGSFCLNILLNCYFLNDGINHFREIYSSSYILLISG